VEGAAGFPVAWHLRHFAFICPFRGQARRGSIGIPAHGLYLVTPLAAVLGGLWQVNAMRTYRIGIYIRDALAPKLNDLLRNSTGAARVSSFEVLAWESSAEARFAQVAASPA
jgi:hypothetical protein